jgi:two-component system, NarL family, response regulator NreC
MDIGMPVVDGLEATRLIKSSHPEIQILVLTMHRSHDYFFEILKAGASGYLLKGADPGDLIKAVKVVHRGEVFLYPTMAQKLLHEYFTQMERINQGVPKLSARENEILILVAEGYSYKEIADKLVLSPSTIHTHSSNLMNKLGLTNRRELIQFAREHGLIKDA